MLMRSVLIFLCALAASGFADALIAQDSASPVIVAPVVRRELGATQVLVGTVLPARRSVVGSAVDARVKAFHVNAGDAVKQGQPLVECLTGTLEIQLRAAKAELAIRAAELDELKNGALPEEIEQSTNQLAAAAAILKSRKSRFERSQTLFKKKAINEEQFDDALSAYDEARAIHAASAARHKLIVKGTRPEQIARAAAQKEFQAEQVNLIDDRIAKHTIRAPFDGFVSVERTEVGHWVKQGDVVVEVVELARVEVEVFLVEHYLRHLKPGATVRVEVPAVPGKFFTGTIQSIIPQADTRARSFPVRVSVKNETDKSGPVLKSGMLARVPVPVGERRKAVMVPKDALVLGGREPVVFVVGKSADGAAAAKRIPVVLGAMDDNLIEVDGAVSAGDSVVIRGNERLKDGQIVAPTLSADRTSRADVERPIRQK